MNKYQRKTYQYQEVALHIIRQHYEETSGNL